MVSKNDIFFGVSSLNIEDLTQHLIKKLYEAKYSIVDMSLVLGLSDRTIHRHMNILGIGKHKSAYKLKNPKYKIGRELSSLKDNVNR